MNKILRWRLEEAEGKEINLEELKNATFSAFKDQSDNAKQKLVFNLLEAAKNKDQNRFFNLLLKWINKPKENFNPLINKLKEYYNILPEEAFVNFAYSVIIGIMSTYNYKKCEVRENETE